MVLRTTSVTVDGIESEPARRSGTGRPANPWSVGRFHVPRQLLEVPFPELAIAAEPALGGPEWPGVQRASVHSPIDGSSEQPGTLKYSNVSRNRGQRHGKGFREFSDHRRSFCQSSEQSTPGAIAEGVKNDIQPIIR